jgi:hypothetical protein
MPAPGRAEARADERRGALVSGQTHGAGRRQVTDVLALTWFGESILVAVVLAVYAAVIWMILDILRRPDFSGIEKVLWSIAGIVFSIATLLVYVLWVRKKDYSR